MAWSTPRTWVTGETVTATIMNQHLRDNLLAVTPAGAVLPYISTTAPSGWLACDGSEVNRVTYATLFSIIGITYGAGDGSNTFNLPDMRGRVPVGINTSGSYGTALGQNEGASLANRAPVHKHTVNDPGHIHGGVVASNTVGGTSNAANGPTTGSTASATTGVTVGPQSGTPTDAPAYLTFYYIIKT